MTVKTAKELRNRLKNRFGKSSEAVLMPEHIVLYEVPVDGVQRMHGVTQDGTEWSHEHPIRRRIDAVAVGMWKRTEHLIHGFEIKVSRADLLSELKNPEKSEPAIKMVDRWWLVLGDAKLLKETDVIPDGWGIMVARGRGLTILKQAEPTGGTPDARFVAALLQSATGGRGSTARALGRREGFDAGYSQGRERGKSEAYWKGYNAGAMEERRRVAERQSAEALESA